MPASRADAQRNGSQDTGRAKTKGTWHARRAILSWLYGPLPDTFSFIPLAHKRASSEGKRGPRAAPPVARGAKKRKVEQSPDGDAADAGRGRNAKALHGSETKAGKKEEEQEEEMEDADSQEGDDEPVFIVERILRMKKSGSKVRASTAARRRRDGRDGGPVFSPAPASHLPPAPSSFPALFPR